MSLSLKASADGLSLDLLLGATLVATFSTSGVEAGTLIASDAEAQGFANLKKLLTPEKLAKAFKGSNQLLALNGYQKLPGGLIFQWVVGISDASGNLSLTLPIAFPNAILGGFANEANPTGWGTNTVTVWAFDLATSTVALAFARARNIPSTSGPTPASVAGRILVWGY